jgi:hypothetical protein
MSSVIDLESTVVISRGGGGRMMSSQRLMLGRTVGRDLIDWRQWPSYPLQKPDGSSDDQAEA